MRRLVNLWLALLAAFWLTRVGASSLLFGRVDESYQALCELIAIPALQALALAWVTRQPGPMQLALPWREGLRLPLLGVALAVDVGVLALSWLLYGPSCPSCPDWLAPAFGGGLPAWMAAAKLLAAAALLVAALCRPGWGRRDRLAVAVLAAGLLVLAAEPWRGWLAGLPDRLAPLPSPRLRWVGANGTLLAAALLLAGQAEAALRRRSRAAALGLDWALGLLLLAAFAALLGFFGPSRAAAPWTRAAATFASLSGTALLVGSALAALARPAAAARLPASGRSGDAEPGGNPS